MAINIGNLVNHYPCRGTRLASYLFTLKFDTAGASNPDGLVPTYEGLTIAKTSGQGEISVTFPETGKPYDVQYCKGEVVNDITRKLRFLSYTQATGVLVMQLVLEDQTSGIEAEDAGDPDNLECRLFAVLTRSDKS